MNDQSNTGAGNFGKITRWIAGLTGILVVIPAIINAGADIYSSFMNIPRTEAETTNTELFEKYFGNSPLQRIKIPLETKDGSINMELEIYGEDGDIFVRYGTRSQWFRSPLSTRTIGLPSFQSAFAQEPPMGGVDSEFHQFDTMQGNQLLRERYFPDGTKESFVIDPRTGVWSSPESGVWSSPESGELETLPSLPSPTVRTYELPSIDLLAIQRLNDARDDPDAGSP